jgi:hypothetical protein
MKFNYNSLILITLLGIGYLFLVQYKKIKNEVIKKQTQVVNSIVNKNSSKSTSPKLLYVVGFSFDRKTQKTSPYSCYLEIGTNTPTKK